MENHEDAADLTAEVFVAAIHASRAYRGDLVTDRGPHEGVPVERRVRAAQDLALHSGVTGRKLVLHLPTHWPWAESWQSLHALATGPPEPART